MGRRIGLTLSDDHTARVIESGEVTVACVEIAAEGFFARPSPYLAWLGRKVPLAVRAPGLPQVSELSAAAARLAAVCAVAKSHLLTLPIASSATDGIKLPQPLSLPLDHGTSSALASLVTAIRTAGSGTILIEPVASPVRLTDAVDEPLLLASLCDDVGCRLLIDVTAVWEESLRHGFDARRWLGALPVDVVAAARIRTAPGLGDSGTPWALLDTLCARTSPSVVLLDAGPSASSARLADELDRLRAMPEIPRPIPRRARASLLRVTPPRIESDVPMDEVTPEPVEAPSDPPRLAEHVSLHVLDTAGVCFDAVRHELSLLNTTATFVWCLLEDGDDVLTVAGKYAETFQIDKHVARRHVGTVLRDWFGRGFATAPGPLPATPLPLVTAVAMLVTNPSLRAAFRAAPSVVAERLRVEHGERATFVALSPDALDAQATDVEPDASETTWPDSTGVPCLIPNPADLVGHFSLLSSTFAVYADDQETREAIGQTLRHLSTSGAADVVLQVRDRSRLFEGSTLLLDLRDPQTVVPAVKERLRALAVERRSWLLTVHAGVVAFGDDCVLLPAAAGSGKTTLVAALVRAGATYFSDELAPLDPDTLAVAAAPLALTIKDGGVAPLAALFPQIVELTPHVREDHVRVRYLPPPDEHLPRVGATARARALVFPRHDPDAHTALVPMARPDALRRLLDESSLDARALNTATVAALVAWMRGLDCYELPYSSLADAVTRVRGLVS